MANSSVLCRRQEAHHLQLAADATLENVRSIALTAARAWSVQAAEAESREARTQKELSSEDAAIALEFLREETTDGADKNDAIRPYSP